MRVPSIWSARVARRVTQSSRRNTATRATKPIRHAVPTLRSADLRTAASFRPWANRSRGRSAWFDEGRWLRCPGSRIKASWWRPCPGDGRGEAWRRRGGDGKRARTVQRGAGVLPVRLRAATPATPGRGECRTLLAESCFGAHRLPTARRHSRGPGLDVVGSHCEQSASSLGLAPLRFMRFTRSPTA